MGFLDDDRLNPLSDIRLEHVYDDLPKGRAFNPERYEPELMALLQPHPSEWRIVDKHDYAELTNLHSHGGRVKIIAHLGGRWVETRDMQQTHGNKGLAVFVRRPTSEKKAGGNSQQTAAPNLYTPQVYENLEPTVLISSPDKNHQIKLDDKKLLTTSFKDHAFTKGETVNSVVKQYTGENRPGAILNYNPSFNQNKLPQEGDTVRVAVGRALKVDGTVSNAPTVILSWVGPTYGRKTISGTQGGKNQIVGWSTTIDEVKPGKYSLTAVAGSAVYHSEFVLLNDKPWIGIEYRDMYGELVKNAPFKLTFADKSTLTGNTGDDGQFYKTPVPPGPVAIEFYPDQTLAEIEDDIAQKRAALKQALDTMYNNAKSEADIRRKTLDDNNVLIQGLIYVGAFFSGTIDGFVPEMPQIPEEIVQALGQVWDAVMDADISKFDDAIAKLQQAGQQVVADVAEALKMLMYDSESRKILVNFATDYARDCITGVDATYYAGYAIGSVAMTIILTIGGALLAGYGALIGVGFGVAKLTKWMSKFIELLKKLGQAIRVRTQKLVKKGNTDSNHKLQQGKPTEQVQKPKSVEDKKVKPVPAKMDRVDVDCFNGANFPGKEAEYDRQLKGQQDALNKMSAQEYKEGRDLYKSQGRTSDPKVAKEARKEHADRLYRKYMKQYQKEGYSPDVADGMASAKTKEIMSELAALHNPDMYAGGKDQITDLGDKGINSSIGSQWKSRVDKMDEAVSKIPVEKRNSTGMNVSLTRCK